MFPTFEERYYPQPTYFDSIPGKVTMEEIFTRMRKEGIVDQRVKIKDAIFYVTVKSNYH